ncbi:MAG: hypothetical protein JWO58_823 [Chitinophagaceae bacterium]|nr:hypothetical protein [Chitinophagaceae bacterium]
MKNIIRTKYVLLTTLLVLSLSSCNSKKDDPSPSAATGTLMFHLHTFIDTTEVGDYNTIYKDTTGRKISFSMAQLYISNVELKKTDGTYYSVADSMVLQVQDNEQYTVATVPAGNYTQVRFHVGFDPTTNQKNPSLAGLLNKPAMWFNSTWNSSEGYVFVNLQGKIDTTAAHTAADADLVAFDYKIGTNSNYKLVTMPPKNYTVTPSVPALVHITTSYNKLFDGIDLTTPSNLTVSTVSDNATPLAMRLANNISLMFSYESEE